MSSFVGRTARVKTFLALVLLSVGLVTINSDAAPRGKAAVDDVFSIWSPIFRGDDRNIEEYATSQVRPLYPTAAQRYRIEGVVTVKVTVDKNGRVVKAEFVRGHSVFRSVSLDAAKQWQFNSPNSGELEGTINFTFKLEHE
jgi:TonB family protein